jgi:hypothetical protein
VATETIVMSYRHDRLLRKSPVALMVALFEVRGAPPPGAKPIDGTALFRQTTGIITPARTAFHD